MSIKRYWATADTTITNAYKDNLSSRGTGSNMGLADSLEVFSIYGQASGSKDSGFSQELSRVLVKFPIGTSSDATNSIQAHRNAGSVPASGNVSFFLKMYNVEHGFTLPVSGTYNIFAASSSWEEGRGLDMNGYLDITKDGEGANWINRASGSTWGKMGGDYHTASADKEFMYRKNMILGDDDLDINVTGLVEQWMKGVYVDHGFGIFLTSSQEAYFSSSTGGDYSSAGVTSLSGVLHNIVGAKKSYYTKKFSARSSEYFFKRPVIEARWDSSTKDDRGGVFYSSSLATPEENLNSLYFYNYFKGKLRDIPGQPGIYVGLFSGNADNTKPSTIQVHPYEDNIHVKSLSVTASKVSTGVWSASFALTAAATPLNTLFDVWYLTGNALQNNIHLGTQFHTGSFSVTKLYGYNHAVDTSYASSISNLRKEYSRRETARFRVYARQRDWNPTIYSKAVATAIPSIIDSGSWRVYRVIDELDIVPFGTGSDNHTQMSFDVSGNYFDLDMGMLDSGYAYAIKLAYYNDSVGDWVEQPEMFKFRVED
tara:strand:- start:3159 stop:4778 length:1620 start_codon:yes stop_codon:yes gene_type:complete